MFVWVFEPWNEGLGHSQKLFLYLEFMMRDSIYLTELLKYVLQFLLISAHNQIQSNWVFQHLKLHHFSYKTLLKLQHILSLIGLFWATGQLNVI